MKAKAQQRIARGDFNDLISKNSVVKKLGKQLTKYKSESKKWAEIQAFHNAMRTAPLVLESCLKSLKRQYVAVELAKKKYSEEASRLINNLETQVLQVHMLTHQYKKELPIATQAEGGDSWDRDSVNGKWLRPVLSGPQALAVGGD